MADYLSFLKNSYNTYLGRDPDPSGLESWGNALKSGSLTENDVLSGIVQSPEYMNRQAQASQPSVPQEPQPSAPQESQPVFNLPTLTPDMPSTSTAGINWDSPGASGLLDQIRDWTSRSSEMAKNAMPMISNFYNSLMRNSLGPEAFQGTLNDLRRRNMFGSPDIVSDALNKARGDISTNIGNQAYDTFLKTFDAQTQMPGFLTDIANTLGERKSTSVDPYRAYDMVFSNYV